MTAGRNQPEDLDQEEAEETGGPPTLRRPAAPTRKEREEHEATHIPYREWCEHCVAGKSRNTAHKTRQKEEEPPIPVIALDYMF